jgi:anti-anti-sigma factor
LKQKRRGKLEIQERVENGISVVSVSGMIDSLTSEKVRAAFLAQINAGAASLVADLGGVNYTSSAGLRALLAVMKAVRHKKGDLRLACVQPNVQKVLEMSGFTSIFKLFEDVDAAVASFKAG